ncbi:collagen alpha-1(I) chain-like [Muntiacus reevesi]|uniref:collagen alpha-1(I) chain-like n=1 Tax=Muntiacus reevesi TaxID=9886 RepID=UPI003306BFF4
MSAGAARGAEEGPGAPAEMPPQRQGPVPPPSLSRVGGSSAALGGAPGPERGSDGGGGRTGKPSAPAPVAEPRRARRRRQQQRRLLRVGRANDPDVQGNGEEGEGGMPGSERRGPVRPCACAARPPRKSESSQGLLGGGGRHPRVRPSRLAPPGRTLRDTSATEKGSGGKQRAGLLQQRRQSPASGSAFAVPPALSAADTPSGNENLGVAVSFSSAQGRNLLLNPRLSQQLERLPPGQSSGTAWFTCHFLRKVDWEQRACNTERHPATAVCSLEDNSLQGGDNMTYSQSYCEGVRRGAVTPGTPSLRAPPRAPRSWVDPGGGPAVCTPRVRPPQPTRSVSSGRPVPAPRRAPHPRGAPTPNRRTPGAARIASLPLPAAITRAPRTPRPPRGQVGSQGARGPAGRPGRRRRRSRGHVPGDPGERRGEHGRGRAGASGAAAAVSGLAGLTSPPQVCERPPPRRHSSSSSSGGPGERQARNNYKRKRRVEEEEETPFTLEKPSRPRSHKRRTPADAAPSPPHRGARRQRARRPGTAPRRPPPQNPAAGAGVRAGARGDLGHVAAGGRAAAWGALGGGVGGARRPPGGVDAETPAPGGAEMAQGHSPCGRAPVRTLSAPDLQASPVPSPGSAPRSPVPVLEVLQAGGCDQSPDSNSES